ncbi:phosphoribosyl-AMP cyclohydrolase [Methanocella sp. CWC-04]|uniref:Phosphoribosyl-AMP cyclohydrolase n=1 Tax=Methanooceanicella nereidis TaxID=2052831 RepID=A0AAP2RAV2_9EURY|nr:phosphoribosyl-AMP cyclohydrolase [Methanocella sp. CWC-04]MCD1294124.1 phosphoribosyl-AMP cyclohydrolase [Methanocella sp. CWC-04]
MIEPIFKDGLVPAIAQDFNTREVLMFAYMNREAFELTVSTGMAHYFSRSRGKIWKKGETSGHVQKVREIRIDCDRDCVLLLVEQDTAACHTGYISCFYRTVQGDIVGTKAFNPEDVYPA